DKENAVSGFVDLQYRLVAIRHVLGEPGPECRAEELSCQREELRPSRPLNLCRPEARIIKRDLLRGIDFAVRTDARSSIQLVHIAQPLVWTKSAGLSGPVRKNQNILCHRALQRSLQKRDHQQHGLA